MFRSILFILGISLISSPLVAAEAEETTEQIGYIKDDLHIFLHAGPSNKFRIKGSVPAGTRIHVLERDEESGYLRIRDHRERIGWVDSKNFTVEATKSQIIEKYEAQISSQQEDIEALTRDLSLVEGSIETRSKSLNEQLDKLKRDTKVLAAELSVAQSDKLALQKHINELKGQNNQIMMLYGGGIAGGGIILGLILSAFRKKRSAYY